MKHIFLIGFMGSGKSSVGKRLSFALKRPFADMDGLIESKEQKKVTEIFDQNGEEYFRNLETDTLKEFFDKKLSYVVSTGGGLPMRERNRRLLKKQGIIIYLRAKSDTLYERLKNDDKRPLLKVDDPKKKIEELLEQRSGVYEALADRVVDVDGKNIQEVMNEVLLAFEQERNLRRENREKRLEKAAVAKILVIHGPNLNFLGIREPEVYGKQTYEDLQNFILVKGSEKKAAITFFQSNHEGDLVDRLQEAYYDGTDGIIINPGALTHYSYSLHDALMCLENIPKIEVHLSDITKREDFRAVSVTKDACQDQIYGKGFEGYELALDKLLEMIQANKK